MSAQIRILPQDEADAGFSLLKDIVEMVKNPKAIDEAYERRRKAAILTDDEAKKAEEARAYIAKYDALVSDVKDKEVALDTKKLEHETQVSLFKKEQEDRLTSLQTREGAVRLAEDAIAAAKRALDSERKQFESEKSENDKRIADSQKKILDREKAVKDGEAANTAEAERLKDIAEKYKAKAARLAAEAQSDG